MIRASARFKAYKMNVAKMLITSEEEEDGAMLCHPLEEDHHGSGGDAYDDEEDEISDISDEEDDEDDEHLAPPPPVSQHTFAPPFYGRPPTPLPPSPSLTSLLRPSRPTTPDASDDETVANGSGGPEGSGAEPLPRASPRVPTYEYYGFVLYLFSSLSFLIYLLWAYLPSPFLHALGIYYYPNRWWSLAIPSFLTMMLVYIYVALAAYNTEYLTLPLGSIETIVDEAAQVAVVDSKGQIIRLDKKPTERRHGRHASTDRDREVLLPGGGLNWREVWNEGTDAVMDVPLAGVCEVLYGEGRERRGLDGSEEERDDEPKSLHDLANGLVGSRVGKWG